MTPARIGVLRVRDKHPPRRRDRDDGFYSRARWRRFRADVLARHPFCADPFGAHAAAGVVVDAVDLDHIRSRHVAPELAYEELNCRPLCKRCHGRLRRAPRGGAENLEVGARKASRHHSRANGAARSGGAP